MSQRGNECLLTAFLIAAGETDRYTEWKSRIDEGIEEHRQFCIGKYPDHPEWCEKQVGSAAHGYLPSDILRGLKKSGKKFTWKRLIGPATSFTRLLKRKEILVITGVATESDIKTNMEALEKAEHRRGGQLHAVCLYNGTLYDPGQAKARRVSPQKLRAAIRRIRRVYIVSLNS